MSGTDEYLWDPNAEADAGVAEIEGLLRSSRYVATAEVLTTASAGHRRSGKMWIVPVAVGLATAAAVLAYCQPAVPGRVEPPAVSDAPPAVAPLAEENAPAPVPPPPPPPPRPRIEH